MSLGIPTARISVETPEQTLMMAFSDYQGSIEKMLHKEMDRLMRDGEIAKMAVKELERRLPKFIEDRVSSAMYEMQIDKYLGPILLAAFKAVLESFSKATPSAA